MKLNGKSVKCAVSGALAGAANGFFGAGGGMLLAPLFNRWVKTGQREAFAGSVCVILPMCIVSAAVYIYRSGFDFRAALPYLFGGLAGGFIGGRVFKRVSMLWLRRVFGAVIIFGGLRLLL